jgi:hypothetical protein
VDYSRAGEAVRACGRRDGVAVPRHKLHSASEHPVNVDAHNIKTYSRKAMKHAFMPQEDRYGKALRTFYTQDQTSKKPLIA